MRLLGLQGDIPPLLVGQFAKRFCGDTARLVAFRSRSGFLADLNILTPPSESGGMDMQTMVTCMCSNPAAMTLLAPPPSPVSTPPLPLPEAVRGDAWSWAGLPLGSLKEVSEWPLGFNDLLPVPTSLDPDREVPGLRLFSRTRSLALAGWLGGLEPVRLRVSSRQLILDAGQDDCWLVSDLSGQEAEQIAEALHRSSQDLAGFQFIAVQSAPDSERFEGFWMLRDQPQP